MTAIKPRPSAESTEDALRRADTKAATLLQVVGLALAGAIALVATRPTGPAAALLWLALGSTSVSILLLLLTILPRLGPPVPGTWLHAASAPAEFDNALSIEQAAASAREHLCQLARLAVRKYRYLQAAVVLLMLGLFSLVPALALLA